MAGATLELASFVANSDYDSLPEEVVQRTKLHILDVFATGFVGSGLPWARMVYDLANEQSSAPQSSVFGASERMSMSCAALVNGVMVSSFEADHSGHTAHPAGTVMPGAIAVAEHLRASGKDLILAASLGYEVVCRIGDAQTRSVEDERGFHNPGANGPFSSAAAVGKLLGLDTDQQASAFGIAGSRSGGLIEYAWDGSMTKRLHLGLATQSGLESALLAAKGFTGPATVLEGRFGYFHAFSPSPKPETLLNGLGSTWRMITTRIKAYPCHGTSQALVAAMQQFRREHDVDPGSVEGIHLRASAERLLQERFLDPNPKAHLQAQCSIPYTLSVALHRDLSDPLQFDESVLDDEGIRSMASRVTWEEVEFHDDPLSATIDIVMKGSTHRLAAGAFRGSLQNPADMDDVEDKFRRYSRHVIDGIQQDAAVEAVRGLEGLSDVSELAALMLVGRGRL